MQRTQMQNLESRGCNECLSISYHEYRPRLATTALSSRAHDCCQYAGVHLNWMLRGGADSDKVFCMLCSVRGTTHGWRCCGGGRQALEALRKLRSEKTAEIKQFRLALDHTKTHKVHPIPPLFPSALPAA